MIDYLAQKRLNCLLVKEQRLARSIARLKTQDITIYPFRQWHEERPLELSWTREKIIFWNTFLAQSS